MLKSNITTTSIKKISYNLGMSKSDILSKVRKITFVHFLIIFGVFSTLLFSVLTVKYYEPLRHWYIKRSYDGIIANTELSQPGFKEVYAENAALELLVISSVMQKSQDQSANQERLSQQTREISKFIGQSFGEEKEKEVFELMMEYNVTLIEYCSASRDKDVQKQTNAIVKFTGFPKRYAKFFSGLSKNINHDHIQYGISEYQAVIKTTIDSQSVGDFESALSHADLAKVQGKQLGLILEDGLKL